MLELDFRHPGQCELSYVGLVPDLAGQGHGRWLMAHALALAWRKGVARVWVHTCTLGNPAAPGFYRARGVTPVRRRIDGKRGGEGRGGSVRVEQGGRGRK